MISLERLELESSNLACR